MPVEVMASRGVETLTYGPLKPVGLPLPSTGKEAYAVVQLRKENTAGTMYNMGVDFAAAGWAYNVPEIEKFMRENCDYYLKTVAELSDLLFK